ncbi:MAG: FAD-dependent oxidoreductase [Lentisphaeria bacterium]|nr:FAD-dependent oxidoreductase [Lentisphaeria bacterium]
MISRLRICVLGLVFYAGLGRGVEFATGVCVIGGGSGGVAAALAAAREGAQVVLVEKERVLGGTGTAGLVCLWGATPAEDIAREIYDRLAAEGKAGIARRLGSVPYHCWTIDPLLSYESTLTVGRNRVVYDPDGFAAAVLEMLRSHGVTVLLETAFTAARAEKPRVRSVEVVARDGSRHTIGASVFVDATGDVYLCRAIGCQVHLARDLNGISLCYRVTRAGTEAEDVLQAEPLQRTSCNHQLPNGDRIVNMLPTLPGRELVDLGYDEALRQCQELVRRHWAWLRSGPGDWKGYHFAETASLLGIREGYRIEAEYMLCPEDLRAGFTGQPHRDMIALAAHGVDTHGTRPAGGSIPVKPYGIPYRCLIPKGWANVLVACRGAGFDPVAAASVRLQRTMLWLGHAAGIAAAMAAREEGEVGAVDVTRVIEKVGMAPDAVRRLLSAPPGPEPPPEARTAIVGSVRHEFLCTDNGQGKVLRFDGDGRCVWEVAAPGCQDVWALPDGHVLFSYITKEGGGVREVNARKETVWEFGVKGAVHGCQRLPNGNTALGECGACRVIVVTPGGEIVQETPLTSTTQNPHYHMRHIRVTPEGNVLVAHPKEAVVREYTPDGTVLREITNVGRPFTAVRLENGNTLVAGGDDCLVTEVDPADRIVWQLRAADVPEVNFRWAAGVQRLPNGNTVFCNWLGHGQYGKGVPLVEVTPDKRIVWRFTDNQATRSISSVCLLDALPAVR